MDISGLIGVLVLLIVLACIIYGFIRHAEKRIKKDWETERGYGHE